MSDSTRAPEDDSRESSVSEETPSTSQTRSSSSGFSLTRVLGTVAILAVVGGLAAGAVWYVMNKEPKMYPVKGVVYLDGKPMAGGVILTMHTGGWPGSRSGIDEEGRFELFSDAGDGAYAGQHTVTFTLTDGAFPPTNLLPDKYGDQVNPPFTIDVNAQTQNEEIKFELVGGKEAPARGDGGGFGGGGGGGGRRPRQNPDAATTGAGAPESEADDNQDNDKPDPGDSDASSDSKGASSDSDPETSSGNRDR